MITEKELRTGNLYSTIRNQEVIVIGIDTLNKVVSVMPSPNDQDKTTQNETSIIFEDLNPIEITHTRVTQLGFLKDGSMRLDVISENNVRFIWDDKLKQVVLVDCNDGSLGQQLIYIHQFQNIYYFLTGMELPISNEL